MVIRELPHESVQGLELLPAIAVAIRIGNGLRPDVARVKPKYCAEIPNIVNIMQECWANGTTERPSAYELLDQFNSKQFSVHVSTVHAKRIMKFSSALICLLVSFNYF